MGAVDLSFPYVRKERKNSEKPVRYSEKTIRK